ncbi:hypothetical protein [Amycolatopsis sp. H20-H5]|uniref:hypothetical protein n=1 Tax=Amycolatopsis sp. H20-H5 TaxID=3046309 RepID=UPI002DB91DE6|nr:hypothetical protein [Amycolatopsis sp. H20-H5]MEC3975688.1 hypothetical protein [Amycolatopsis sp. H20-H5]
MSLSENAAAKALGAGLSVQAIQQASAETRKLVDAANSGGFTISPQGVEPLREALKTMADELDRLNAKTVQLNDPPKLGNHPYAHAVAAHDRKGAADEAGSTLVALKQFGDVLRNADKALARAAALYGSAEQHEHLDAAKKAQATGGAE